MHSMSNEEMASINSSETSSNSNKLKSLEKEVEYLQREVKDLKDSMARVLVTLYQVGGLEDQSV